ncbi:MAG: sialidase family protein, partial [Bacteroidota bacterium]
LDGLPRLPNGTLFAIGTTARPSSDVAPPPTAFRSDDSGRTFSAEPLAFHPAGLAERNGTLYVATNDYGDGFALASSSDGGRTWRPRLRFRDISGVKDCVRTSCQQDCDFLAGLKLFPPETCNPPPPRSKGCGCALAAPDDGAAGVALGAAALVAGIVLARRRARRR